MPSSVRITRQGALEVAEGDAGRVRIVKVGDRYYRPSDDVLAEIREGLVPAEEAVVRDSLLPLVGCLVPLALSFLLPLFVRPSGGEGMGIAASVLFVAVAVVLHEGAHALMLKLCYPDARMSAGFKLTFVFPTFYVNTSDSYLLPRYKRLAVYLAGNAVNAAMALVAACVPGLRAGSLFLVGVIAMNLLPIMKSDGYHVWLTLRGRFDADRGKVARRREEWIRGMVSLGILSVISLVARALFG